MHFSKPVTTSGIEFFGEHHINKLLKFTIANSFIDQKMTIDNKEYHGLKDFDYLLKTSLQYNNPQLFTIALIYTGHPSGYYNEIGGAVFDDRTGFYRPVFVVNLYSGQYGNYNRFDISISKYIRSKNNAVIAFLSINNIFDSKNQRQVQYNADYFVKHFDYYQFRTVYFGLVWQWNLVSFKKGSHTNFYLKSTLSE